VYALKDLAKLEVPAEVLKANRIIRHWFHHVFRN
jgi:hypothetical protein